MMAQPSFIARARQRMEPPTAADELVAQVFEPRAPVAAENPFDRASADLAARWDAMVMDLESSRAEAEHHRAENIHLGSEVDRLRKELETRISFFDLEVNRLTLRADRAVDENVDRRAKLEIIVQALQMVLSQTLATAPINREPQAEPVRESSIAAPPPRRPINTVTHKMTADGPVQLDPDELRRNVRLADKHIPRDFNSTPREGHPTSDEDGADAHALIARLAPVTMQR